MTHGKAYRIAPSFKQSFAFMLKFWMRLGIVVLPLLAIVGLIGSPAERGDFLQKTALMVLAYPLLLPPAAVLMHLAFRFTAWSIAPNGLIGRKSMGIRKARLLWHEIDRVFDSTHDGFPELHAVSLNKGVTITGTLVGADHPRIYQQLVDTAGPDHRLTQLFGYYAWRAQRS